MENKYNKLLKKYANDSDLFELLELCVLDEENVKEIFYDVHFNYPEKRDLLGKLKMDLCKNRD